MPAAQVVHGLEQEHDRSRSPAKREALKQLKNDLQNQGEHLSYARFRDQGFDIGCPGNLPDCRASNR